MKAWFIICKWSFLYRICFFVHMHLFLDGGKFPSDSSEPWSQGSSGCTAVSEAKTPHSKKRTGAGACIGREDSVAKPLLHPS